MMRKLLLIQLALAAFILLWSNDMSAQSSTQSLGKPPSELIYGYPATDFYFKTVQIPAQIASSEKKEDRVKVALHKKIVAFEQESLRPLKSLEKNQMESLLATWQAEVIKELDSTDGIQK